MIMATEFKLSYTASDINSRLGKIDNLEPATNDIPKVFFGKELPQTKTDAIMSFRYVSKTKDIKGYCKTKAQGTSSMNYPKKNQTVKLYKDVECTEKLKVDFKGWGKQNKFCFKANWVDCSHSRNIVCARLWGDMVSSRADYTELPEELQSSPNNGAVDGFPVKLYANGEYQGIYTLNIPKDAWMVNMDEDNPNHVVLCAETNTNGNFAETPCNFRALWDGVDENHWSVEVGTNSEAVKNSLNALISCVKDTDDDTFKATIGNHLDIQSAIDYYILQYVVYGVDGLAKNMLLYTYNGTKWFCGAYDMDTVFGASSSNNYFFPYNRKVPEDCAEAYSLLWSRIEDLYAEELKARYVELRHSVLTVENIINEFERFTDIISHDLYTEDGEIFPDIPSLTTNNIKQIRKYANNRLNYCDTEFSLMGNQAEYIESHGAEHIYTGISGGTNASYEMKMAVCEGNSNWAWFVKGGTLYDGYENHLSIYQVGGNVLTGMPIGDRWIISGTNYYDQVVTWDGATGTLNYGGRTRVTNDNTVLGLGWGDTEFNLFNNAYMKLYYLTMYTNGELVRDFIPMYHIVRGEFGLYDKVSGKYFATASGAFTGVITEKVPETYETVNYIESHDAGTIDTGISGGRNASYEMKMAVCEGNGDWVFFVNGGTNYSGYNGGHLAIYSVSGHVMTGMPTGNVWVTSLTDYADKVVTWDGTAGTLNYNGKKMTTNNDTVPGLGWGDDSFKVMGGYMKLYYLKMYTDGVLVRDFVPVKRSDGVYGLLDNVSGEFFTKAELTGA